MTNKLLLTILLIFILPIAVLSEDEEDNPHEEMVDDQFVCLECHTDVPKEGMTSPDYFLLDPPSEHCLGCHDETEHSGGYKHLGKDADEGWLADENGKMACFTCHDPHPEGVIKGRKVFDAEASPRSIDFMKLVVLPYLEEETGEELELGHEKEVLLRLPTTEGELCIKCHQERKEKGFWKKITVGKFTELFSY